MARTEDPSDISTTLDIALVAELRGEDVAAIYRYRRNYKPGHPNAFPAPDPYPVRSPLWNANRADELKAWAPTGRGKGGGRPRKTPAPAPAPPAPAPAPAPAAPLQPRHREILEDLLRIGDTGPGWGNCVIAGRYDPEVHLYPHATLNAMAKRGWLRLGKQRDNLIGTSEKLYTIAKITREGFEALAADTLDPIAAEDLTADEITVLTAAANGRISRRWEGVPAGSFSFGKQGGWQGLLDNAPAGSAWAAVDTLVAKGALMFCDTDALVTGAGHAVLNAAASAQPDHSDVIVEPVVRVTHPVFTWIDETAGARQWLGHDGVIDGSTQDKAALTFLRGMVTGTKGKRTRASYGWTYGNLIALRRMVAHMVDTIDPAHSRAAADKHTAAVDNLAHLDHVISKTEHKIKRATPATPATPAPLKFKHSKESGAHVAEDDTWKYNASRSEVIDAFGKRRRYWRLTAVRPDDKTSLEESTHDTKALCLAVAQEFSSLGLAYRPEQNEFRSRMTEATARAYEWDTK